MNHSPFTTAIFVFSYEVLFFQVLFVLVLLLIVMFLYRIKTRHFKNQNKLLEENIKERTKDLDKTIRELSQEIEERKNAEAKVQASLEEKEILLKEVHHRVKNNLQVISSLLYLQSLSINDEVMHEKLKDSQNRIKSMSLIHEKLYQSENFSEINFKEYVESLVLHFNHSFLKENFTIITSIDIDDINLSLDTAIACGLLVNELMTNAYKHAFPDEWINENRREGKIDISVRKETEKNFLLLIADNGVGLPANINISNVESLGLKIVNSMVAQLGGSIEISSNNGTQFKIYFTDSGR